MKRILTLALLFSAMVGWAQTDVSHYITDPDFDVQAHAPWTTNAFGRQGNDAFELKHGEFYREIWSGGTAMDGYIYQDLTNLPVGTYTLTMTCQNIKQSNTSQVCTGAWIYANEEKTDFNKPGDYSVTCIVRDGKLRIGAETKSCTGNYVCIDYCRLTYQLILDDVRDYIVDLIAKVDEMEKDEDNVQYNEMIEARNALKVLLDANQEEGMDTAVKLLESAILNYGYSAASSTNPLDVTDLVTNPGFESGNAGWTLYNMGVQGNTSFSGKVGSNYVEHWTGSGGIASCYVKQTVKNLPTGRYRLTASAWNIQQNSPSQKQTGAYLYIDATTTEVNVLGKYTVEAVSVAGSVNIGIKAVNATGNYCCVDDFKLYYLGSDADAEADAFQTVIAQAESLLPEDMNTDHKTALEQAIATGKAVTTDKIQRAEAALALLAAIDSANVSIPMYDDLDAVIKKGQDALALGLAQGQDMVNTALASAQNLKNSGDIDTDKVKTADKIMDDGIFRYRVANGTGTAPQVTTFPTVIVGGNGMVGRLTATGSNILESGFCWAEHPNPTIDDEFSSYSQTNNETANKPVYVMYGVKASTEYWVRAYSVSKNYAVGYGEAIRVITLPQGETVYTFLWNGDDEHNIALDNAMREATAYYNIWTAIKGFRPTANYSPGTETADCSYGGWINVGPWRCNTGTMVHEMMHGTGVGQHGRWWDANLHNLDVSVDWLGERGNRVTNFFEPGYVCNGDGIHVCYEGNGNDMQQIRSAILAQALYEDGLPAVHDGACPFYSYESIDTLHYYITHNEYGTTTKYLRDVRGSLKYQSVGSIDDLLADDSYAWRVLYDKMTGLYSIQNKATGKYISHKGNGVSLVDEMPANSNKIHLMPSRIFNTLVSGEEEITMKPYWFAQGNRVLDPYVMEITNRTAANVTTPTLDFSNNAIKQFWLICTPEELMRLNKGANKVNYERLDRMIAGSRAVAASNHKETVEGQTKAFVEVVDGIEEAKAGYTTNEVETAVNTLCDNLVDYLSNVEVIDSIDVSFFMDDPELNTGVNWDDMVTLTDGKINIEDTPEFSATQKSISEMPKGEYGMLVRGYQAPGTLSQSMKDYVANKNNVSVSVTLISASAKIKHIGAGSSGVKLDKGGREMRYSGFYVPFNDAADDAYFAEGRYDNFVKAKTTMNRAVAIGIKNASKVAGDKLVVDGFKLFYYGNPDLATGIEDTLADEAKEVEGYYNAAGVRSVAPTRGINIIKYKDGSSKKVYIK